MLLRRAVAICRDQGIGPQLAATIDWALGPLLRTDQATVAARLIGALTDGALAGMSGFPGVDGARSRSLERIRASIGGEEADRLLAEGAAMTYDEVVAFALGHMELPEVGS